MNLRPITSSQKYQYNKVVTHVIQSWQWGEFREKLGLKILRFGLFDDKDLPAGRQGKLARAFTLSLHKIPFLNYYVGYLPKGPFPDKELEEALRKIAFDNKCAFIKLEPNILKGNSKPYSIHPGFRPSPNPLFTKFNFVLDLSQNEETLLNNMHPKTRYNIRLAQKKGVKVEEREDDEAFEIYLKLYFETTKRQSYFGHSRQYHKKVWQTLRKNNMARILIAFYQKPGTSNQIPLTAWMLLNFKDTLYYPYGGSSFEYREVMASNLVAWEAIKLGKKMGLKYFDMWGALGPNANSSDPWYGFHRFKAGYGGELVEYIGSFDLVLNNFIYKVFTSIDKFTKLKVFLLKLLGQ